ncbi:MAG: GAF domain-containing protein, partial [Anaerolineaceae bacterium]|nr:GAF domain-containing protein [Anaerolineaceae bacterium]
YLFKLAWNIQFGILGAALIFTLCWIGFRRYRLATQLEGRQIRMILIGIGISFLPIAIWLAVSAFSKTKISFVPFLLLPLGVFPILFAYTIQRFRLLSADYILSRVMVYTILAVLVAVGYALVVTGLGMVFSGYFDPFNPLISGLAIFGISLLFLPVRQSMLAAVDQLFFRGNQAYQERLNSLSEAIKDAIDLKTITKIMREHIRDTIAPSQMHVYVFDSMNEQFSAAQDETGKPTSDIRFSSSSALAAALSGSRNPILVNAGVNLSENLKADSTRLRLLGATLIVPLIGSKQLAGWMAFGPRKSGEEYSLKELSFLDKLANQATMAIERAQVLENMEKRVKAMNVLARVAQGVNVTITMDDLFELIYAQTTQILPADDFQISLTNSMSGKLVQEFNVEKDERSTERDGYPLIGAVLEEEVARQRKAIVTTDYVQECQRRGVLSNKAGVYAWVCVPLNTGAETVGVLSMANRNVSEVYTREEVDLLQSIGDQVAGAIVKARLLQESEKRAMQLATLNEVTRQLTSTLDVEPLLNTILQKATDILYCEAGSLLMLDDETGEYVFRATVGPVADDLVNRRLPAGSGLVGKAFTTRQPLIVNNVTEAPDWNAQPDHQTGFITRALLVVPMVVKEKVIGVLEVLNKKDGSPFNTEDQNLLMAFAAQAGVAFDNARLYTTTDQALEARVEELSVMQRIDRELNIGLDSARAMQITLAWAMDQSGATAGLVGPVNEGEVKIQASTGFTEPVPGVENGIFHLEAYNLLNIVESGEPARTVLSSDSLHLLPDGKYRIVLPIRRESATIGLVYLESEKIDPLTDEKFSFLQRLCDHAAVAIANAQLFNAVQAANLAKSEFVSFVAHELKNPMTSIKGYTELLAAGAVGQINEAQTSFLVTIRSNIDRMNTLISDLNDLSKIEAGRLKLEYRAVLLPEVIEETIRSTRKQVEDKNQELVVNLPEGLQAVWADRTRLVQVLVNLVSNAHKYTEQGGKVYIGAEPADNQWDPEGPKKIMHLWVQDTGIGISPEDQKKIFQKFFRSEDPKTREVPGTGLGLNIT